MFFENVEENLCFRLEHLIFIAPKVSQKQLSGYSIFPCMVCWCHGHARDKTIVSDSASLAIVDCVSKYNQQSELELHREDQITALSFLIDVSSSI
jgi:hypothetical protein